MRDDGTQGAERAQRLGILNKGAAASKRPFRLPPLNALRVFHTVVRHRSFRSAADELLVSPQAVSQQMKLLEDILAVELFSRNGRAIEPTEHAILLAHFVQSAFDELTQGVLRVTKGAHRKRINLNVSPYFATRYLLGRLARFRELMPDADIRLTTMVELPDFIRDDVDVAIQWGYSEWAPYESTLLLRDQKIVCCTPGLARQIHSPQDLIGLPLLHPVLSDRLWIDVLHHLGVSSAETPACIRFQDAATMRRATAEGLGVGLISTIDAFEDLKLGKIVAPFGRHVLQDMPAQQVPGFHLVLPKTHRRLQTISAFCRWIEEEDWLAPDDEPL